MITETTTRLKPTNNNAKNLTFGLLIAVIVGMTVYSAIPVYKSIVGAITLLLIVALVFIYTKYISVIYFYDITFDGYGVPVFVVRQVTGKRQSTLARVSLADIISVEREDAEERKKHETPMGVRRYYYVPTLLPKVTYRMTVKSKYEHAEITIEITEEYREMLLRYCAEAKENYPQDSEE